MKSVCVRRIGTRRGDPDSPVVPWHDAHLNDVVNRAFPRSAFPVRFALGSGVCAATIETRASQISFIIIAPVTSPAKRHRQARAHRHAPWPMPVAAPAQD